MDLFVLDTAGDQGLLQDKEPGTSKFSKKTRTLLKEKTRVVADVNAKSDEEDNDSDDDGDYFGLPPPNVDLSNIIGSALAQMKASKTKADHDMEHVKELVDTAVKHAKDHPRSRRKKVMDLDHSNFNALTGKFDDEQTFKVEVQKEMSKTELVPGFEQLKGLPSLNKKKQRELNRIERSKTKGTGWFNLPATEMTQEVKNDLKILQMRSVLDPKHFYKKNDFKVLPKYFQVGTVQHSPLDYYNERDTRKNKKKSLVEELLADAEFQKYNKRKYQEVMAHRDKYAHRKVMKKMKKLKKNK